MKNFDKLLNTFKHRKLLKFLAQKYDKDNEELRQRLEIHDLDKMYLLLFYEKKAIEPVHRALAPHHDNDLEKTELDYIEMVLDWESAKYTKPDKPFNAYDTLYKFYPHLVDSVLQILEKYNIAESTLEKDEDVVEYVNSLKEYTEEDIKRELIEYIKGL